MGAAVGVELSKPPDASDITENGTLELAKGEVIRLRGALGHLAEDLFSDVVYDASDLVHGFDETADFDRCVAEVVHIRSALRLATAGNKRKERALRNPVPTLFSFAPEVANDDDESSSSSSDSEGGDDNDGGSTEKAEAEKDSENISKI